jgi:hypothetical protein
MDATIILRTVGERTTALCKSTLGRQVPGGAIHVVQRTPFVAALRETFTLGVAGGRPYTVVVDADLLPLDNLVEVLLASARADGGDWFEKHALVRCRLFAKKRGAGNRVYRTALLTEALGLVAEFEDALRPEYEVIQAMAGRKHGSELIKQVIGLHGYEQFYRDLYRTAYVHAVKSPVRCGAAYAGWLAQKDDPEFAVILAAYDAGMRHRGKLVIDASEVLGQMPGIEERRTLRYRSQLSPDIQEILTRNARTGRGRA